MRGNIGAILEGLSDAKAESTPEALIFKTKKSSEALLTDFSRTIEDTIEKSLKGPLGWVRCNGSIGMKYSDKSCDNLEIRIKYDPSKDPETAFDLVTQEMEKFIQVCRETPRPSARKGEIIIAQNDIKRIVIALSEVYGIKLDNYFTKASLKNL